MRSITDRWGGILWVAFAGLAFWLTYLTFLAWALDERERPQIETREEFGWGSSSVQVVESGRTGEGMRYAILEDASGRRYLWVQDSRAGGLCRMSEDK
jgi:hypothetical protein